MNITIYISYIIYYAKLTLVVINLVQCAEK